MKKSFKYVLFASLALVCFAIGPASAASDMQPICDLINKMSGVFKILRILAFLGAAFIMAGWAWGWISAGEFKMDDAKKKGIGLIVGFTLLFAIGVLISFLIAAAQPDGSLGCVADLKSFGAGAM